MGLLYVVAAASALPVVVAATTLALSRALARGVADRASPARATAADPVPSR